MTIFLDNACLAGRLGEESSFHPVPDEVLLVSPSTIGPDAGVTGSEHCIVRPDVMFIGVLTGP